MVGNQQTNKGTEPMKKADKNKPAVTMYPKSVKVLSDYSHKVLKQSKNAKLSKDKLPVIKKGKLNGWHGMFNSHIDVQRGVYY